MNQVERNLKGIEFEKEGNIESAIELYEKNIKERFDGSHPYNRLSIIYRKLNRIEDEKRVLEIAVSVFENDVYKKRSDRLPKLEKFKKRLVQVQQITRTN